LQEVLGINAAGVEVILRLRNQVIALQTRVRQLEADLAMWEAGQNTRLTRHREACFEASWQEVIDPEERP
jgi:BMFP domain-containing protein YqiC